MKAIFLKFICLTILTLASTTRYGKAQSAIPMTITDGGHTLIKATINGVEGNFIFDTGAGLTLLTQKFASKVKGIQKQDGQYTAFRATGEKLAIDLFTVPSLTVGPLTQKNTTAAILDANLGGIDGLISLMTFRTQPCTVDYAASTLIFENAVSLKKKQATGTVIPLQLEDGRGIVLDIFTYLRVNDKLTLQFLVDSGAGKNVLHINSKYLGDLNVNASDTTNVKITRSKSEFNPNIETLKYRTTIPVISVSKHPEIDFKKPGVSFIDGLIYDGTTSLNWFGDRLTIDLSQKVMIINKK